LTLSLVLPEVVSPGEYWGAGDWLSLLAPLVVLAFGVIALVRNSRNSASSDFSPLMAIQVTYIANAVMVLTIMVELVLLDDWDMGAWLALTAMLAYALQIILVSVHAGKKAQDRAA
jgi:cell division protein FtsW (lipid II flippase)